MNKAATANAAGRNVGTVNVLVITQHVGVAIWIGLNSGSESLPQERHQYAPTTVSHRVGAQEPADRAGLGAPHYSASGVFVHQAPQKGSWADPTVELLQAMAPPVHKEMTVIVPFGPGFAIPKLWRQIRGQG